MRSIEEEREERHAGYPPFDDLPADYPEDDDDETNEDEHEEEIAH